MNGKMTMMNEIKANWVPKLLTHNYIRLARGTQSTKLSLLAAI